MAKKNILEMILNTINEVQRKNQANPREETADPSVFDLIKSKLQQVDQKSREKRASQGKSPSSILDLIRDQIEGARQENAADPHTKTAPGSVFDNILKKLDERPKRQASTGLRKIIEDYQLDVSRLPREMIQEIQQKYIQDRKQFDQKYAQAIHDLVQRY